MLRITESSVLLRAGVEIPASLIVKKGEFIDGWSVVRQSSARLLEKKTRKCGWQFIRIAGESRPSGVGESPQQAIACALKLAVRSFSEYFNAVEVRRIRVTTYPWFVIARLGVFPCRIQQGPVHFVPDDVLSPPVSTRGRQLLPNASLLFPQFAREMPAIKEMLTQSRSKFEGAQ